MRARSGPAASGPLSHPLRRVDGIPQIEQRTMRGPTVVERDKDKMKALDLALAGIEKAHGKGAVMKMSEKGSMDIETVPTGALALDLALGVGGLPRGRGPEISGDRQRAG